MRLTQRSRWQCRLTTLLVFGTLLTPGCGQRDGVRTYTVQRVVADRPTPPVQATPGQAWFFKLMGRRDAVEPESESFAALMASVRFGESDVPQWETPSGWTERQESGMRFATLTREGSDPPLEIAISALPAEDPAGDAYLKSNIDRWRRQVGLPPYEGGEWKSTAIEAGEVHEAGAFVLVHLNGESPDGDPLAMLAAIVPRPGGAQTQRAAAPPVPASGESTPSYTAPAEWTTQPPRQFQTALWSVADGDQKLEVSVTQSGGSLEMNVDRWRDQVGLPSGGAPGDGIESITVGDREAARVELRGAEQTIVAVIVPQGRMAWFFKLIGPPELVDRELDRFQAFIDSVQFP